MKLRRISLAVLSVLLSAIAALSGFMVYTQLSDRQKEKEEFDTLAEMVEVTPEKPNDETAVPTDDTSEPVRDLSGLFAQNSDCNGWLCIPDTQLSYPVMHTPDNPQKYLRRSFYGEYSQSGVPFLDWRCDLQSDHLIVYGHNMKNGTMFSSLRNYTDPAFCAEHPVIEFQTADGVGTALFMRPTARISPNKPQQSCKKRSMIPVLHLCTADRLSPCPPVTVQEKTAG